MSAQIVRVNYFRITVRDRPGEAHRILSTLASSSVNLLAFSIIPFGGERSELTVFPEDEHALAVAAQDAGLVMDGPNRAILIRGDDQLGAFAEIHRQLADAGINVFLSTGVTSDRGRFGYTVHVRDEDFEQAAHVLGAS